MCGIIGYVGSQDAKDILLDSLELLEYRGYDSAGIALADPEGVHVYKRAGRVQDLRELCKEGVPASTCGIGHTRWATHGGVSDRNAHPHQKGQVALVHNGIIENYRDLIRKFNLEDQLVSETDTEVVAAVLDHYYRKVQDPAEAIRRTVLQLKGTFALVVIFDDKKDEIYCVRNVSPIVMTTFDGNIMLASDVTALGGYTNRYFVLPELCIATCAGGEISLTDLAGEKEVEPEYITVDWELNRAGKNGYPFYMEKEIMEQPEAIAKTVEPHMTDGLSDFTAEGIPDEIFTGCDRVCIIACGTAMHAGLVAQALVQSILRMHIDVEYASEFMYSNPVLDEKTLVIAISQSGETIDTLSALRYARSNGAKSIAIVNVRGSSIAQESDYVIYTNAGPEIAVASTKAYTTQLSILYLIVARMARLKGIYTPEETRAFLSNLTKVPEVMKQVLDKKVEIHKIARKILNAKNVFMIGRGLDYSILLEGSLKLKEVSYIHCEAYASGELKHGTIALITEETPVVAVVTQEKIFAKELSNVKEVRSRGASVILFVKESLASQIPEDEQENIFVLPDMADAFMVMPASVALQLLAYYVSQDKGFDVDKPRNLAKVVTVE
ncbi:MAG: glutamine--fructose-6-phosphate transaminase (isomerizing) [Lachnospiraceae bacterium]|nr:glutamine--fructose-6-phosphate transaminase (isomerizing) [Lachnospiraceae bacterium]